MLPRAAGERVPFATALAGKPASASVSVKSEAPGTGEGVGEREGGAAVGEGEPLPLDVAVADGDVLVDSEAVGVSVRLGVGLGVGDGLPVGVALPDAEALLLTDGDAPGDSVTVGEPDMVEEAVAVALEVPDPVRVAVGVAVPVVVALGDALGVVLPLKETLLDKEGEAPDDKEAVGEALNVLLLVVVGEDVLKEEAVPLHVAEGVGVGVRVSDAVGLPLGGTLPKTDVTVPLGK